MDQMNDAAAELKRLAYENARLHGEIFATGVILTQLLQSICKTQLNPSAFAGRIMNEASDAVATFKPTAKDGDLDDVCKQRALETVKLYEEQIRSVLPV